MDEVTPDVSDLNPVKPCSHMRGLISRLADGSLSGILLWYTRSHVSGCAHCGPAHGALTSLRGRLSRLHEPAELETRLSEERRAALEATLDTIDQGTSK